MQEKGDSTQGAHSAQPKEERTRRHAGEHQRSSSQTGADAFTEGRFSGSEGGARGYRGRSPWHTPPGSVPGGSYGAGGGYQQGGYEAGDWQGQGRDEWSRGYGGYGVTGRGPSPESGWARGATSPDRGVEPGPGEYGYRGQRRDAHSEGQAWAEPGPHTGRGPRDYQRSETAIRDEVCERLTRHGHVDASAITVRVENYEVVLEGDVDSRAAKRMAEDAAESVSGVRDVHNRLRLR